MQTETGIQFEAEDYVVILDGKSKHFGKVLNGKGSNFSWYDPSQPLDTAEIFESDVESVISNIGKNPPAGNVYGKKVKILYKKTTPKKWPESELRYYIPPISSTVVVIKHAISGLASELKAQNLYSKIKVDFEIHAKGGKHTGFYQQISQDVTPIIAFKAWDNENINYLETARHEAGHAIWFQAMRTSLKAEWIEMYDKVIKPISIPSKKVQKFLVDMEGSSSLDEYYDTLEDDDRSDFDEILGYIYSVWGLDNDSIDTLIATGRSLKKYWPSIDLARSTKLPELLTEYATKSPVEFFPEAFSMYLGGAKLPPGIGDLMSKTLDKVRKASPKELSKVKCGK